MSGRAATFDRIVVIDWSARSTPATGRDSIWIARHERSGDVPVETWNPSTRSAAIDLVVGLVSETDDRVLVTIDASVGFPAGTSEAAGLAGSDATGEVAPWRRTWSALSDSIVDDDRNRNNRFAVASEWNRRITGGPGPFWGCPPSARTDTLTSTKPPHPSDVVAEWRRCEQTLRDLGRRPFSCWQLLGVGSVASQSLLAISALERLRRELGAAGVSVDVWPFTSGLRPPDGRVVVAECWPSFFVRGAGADDDRIRDERQVVETAAVLAACDDSGELDRWFSPDLPESIVREVASEEGWILGVDTTG